MRLFLYIQNLKMYHYNFGFNSLLILRKYNCAEFRSITIDYHWLIISNIT